MGIFGETAPSYWAKGLSVIPLKKNDKMPVVDWRMYIDSDTIPENVQNLWLHSHDHSNIGLLMGQASGVCCIDVDTEDTRIHDALAKVLPRSPWKRIGQKGFMVAYKWNTNIFSTNIKDKEGNMLVEVKAKGTQIVLPPSIHPKTMLPYVSNCDLLDVLDQLVELPIDIVDIIRGVLSEFVELGAKTARFNTLDHVPTGARDTKMTQLAGQLTYSIFHEKTPVKRAMDTMVSWVDNMVAKNNGDNLSSTKAVNKLVEFIQKDLAKGKLLPSTWSEGLTAEMIKDLGLEIHESQEEWTINQFHKFMTDEFMNVDQNDEAKKYALCMNVLTKIATSVTLDELQVSMILKDLKDLSGLKVTEANFKKQISQLKKGKILGTSHTEIARVVIEKFEETAGKLALEGDLLHYWNGSHWEEVNEQEIRKIIQCEFGELLMSKKYSDHKQIVSVIRDQVQPYLTANPIDGVNFDNGFLTKDLRLMPHQAEYGMRYTLPYCYLPELKDNCPQFMDYLQYSWGHHEDFEEQKKALQEAICVTFFNISTSFQRAFILYSHEGSTGKSVLMDIISNLVPEETRCALSPERWSKDFSPSSFYGKLLNQAGELHEHHNIEGKIFKQIIDGSPITTAFKHRDEFTFKPKCAHWFASNYLPKSKDTTSGFNRRWLFFVFDRKVPEEEKIIDLSYKIVNDEIEAIVAWATSALLDLMKRQHYTLPKSHMRFSQEMEMQNSSVKQFVFRCVEETGSKAKIAEEDAYKDYYAFTISTLHDKVVPKQKFGIEFRSALNEMKMLNFDDSTNKPYYTGIKITVGTK